MSPICAAWCHERPILHVMPVWVDMRGGESTQIELQLVTKSTLDGGVGVRHYRDDVSLLRPNVTSGPLADHIRKGRTYRSPLAATGVLQIGDWARDDLPDLLWPVLALSELGTAEAVRFVRWQKAVQEDLSGEAEPGFLAECLDGRLTSLDRLSGQVPRAKTVVKARAEECALLPESVASALASYPLRPAEWLVDRAMRPPSQEEIDLLAGAVLDVLTDGHREAVIKCLYIWSAVQAGVFSTSAEMIELLQSYPNDPKTRDKADSVVRAMWGAQRALLHQEDESHFANTIKWAKVFWDANSMTTPCMRRREFDADQSGFEEGTVERPTGSTADGEAPAAATLPEGGAHLRQLAWTCSLAMWRRSRHRLRAYTTANNKRSIPGSLPVPDAM
jgi:hypothetical protein